MRFFLEIFKFFFLISEIFLQIFFFEVFEIFFFGNFWNFLLEFFRFLFWNFLLKFFSIFFWNFWDFFFWNIWDFFKSFEIFFESFEIFFFEIFEIFFWFEKIYFLPTKDSGNCVLLVVPGLGTVQTILSFKCVARVNTGWLILDRSPKLLPETRIISEFSIF